MTEQIEGIMLHGIPQLDTDQNENYAKTLAQYWLMLAQEDETEFDVFVKCYHYNEFDKHPATVAHFQTVAERAIAQFVEFWNEENLPGIHSAIIDDKKVMFVAYMDPDDPSLPTPAHNFAEASALTGLMSACGVIATGCRYRDISPPEPNSQMTTATLEP